MQPDPYATPGPNAVQRPAVDAGRLWAGGAATAVVAALVALVGVLVCDGMFGIAMVRPPLIPVGGSFAMRYAITAAVLALVATGVAHLLLATTPRPRSYFSWIVGLATLVGVVLPFTLDGTLGEQMATAAVNLVIGLAVLSLTRTNMVRTARPAPGPRPGAGPPPRRTW
jgi:hypothetical protein